MSLVENCAEKAGHNIWLTLRIVNLCPLSQAVLMQLIQNKQYIESYNIKAGGRVYKYK